MAFRWCADDSPALWFPRGSRPVLLKNPIFLWVSRGVSGPPPPPIYIRACNEPRREKTNNMAKHYEKKDQQRHQHQLSLIRVYAVRTKKASVLCYPLSAHWRRWWDWPSESTLGTLLLCWFYYDMVQIMFHQLTWFIQAQIISVVSFPQGA